MRMDLDRLIHFHRNALMGWRAMLGCLAAASLASAADPLPIIRLTEVTRGTGILFRHDHGGQGQQYLPEFMTAGLALFDYDNDGWRDVYLLNGAPLRGTVRSTPPTNSLYRNRGDGTFVDVARQAGVADAGFGLGVAAGDFDNDGDADLLLNNFGPNVFYRNNGDGTFSAPTGQIGIDMGTAFGAGVGWLDIESDGDLDLYVANYVDFSYEQHARKIPTAYPYPPGPRDFAPLPDQLFRNEGDGTFRDISVDFGIGIVAGRSMGLLCGDLDDDGDTDVLVCNDGEPNFHFQNDGQGRFQEVGLLSGLAFDGHGRENGSMGVDAGDVDGDGRIDLFITDYSGEAPVLYQHLGGGFYQDITQAAQAGRAAYPHANWGAALVDLDHDRDRDLLIANGHLLTHIRQFDQGTDYRVPNLVLSNRGQGVFADVTRQAGNALSVVASSRGLACDDLDRDGDLDVVVLNAGEAATIMRNESTSAAGAGHWLQVQLVGRACNRDAAGTRVKVFATGWSSVAEVYCGRGYQSHYGTTLHFGLGALDRIERLEVQWHGGGTQVFAGVPANQHLVLRQGEEALYSMPMPAAVLGASP